MGIDIYLEWENKDKDPSVEAPSYGFSTTSGHVGYLREAYHGGPYATKILVREAFEADNCAAQIPAAKMRERLTKPATAAQDCDGGHIMAQMLAQLFAGKGADESLVFPPAIKSGETAPMSVEDAVRERYRQIYPDCDKEQVDDAVQSFRDFVALAELKEKETGKPCTVIASY